MRFEFTTADRIVFGAGTLKEAALAAKQWGRRAFIVMGCSSGRLKALLQGLDAGGIEMHHYEVCAEPSIETVREGVEQARQAGCDLVIGIGGGSTIDTGKAVAALLANRGDVLDYLEVIGSGRPLSRPSVPYIAVPTTAGTGSEVTRNAVLASPEHGVKASLRSPLMLPRLAVVDPELTYSLPPAITASTGMDALTQVIEPFVSLKANPLTDAFCREGIRRVARSLRRAVQSGEDADARLDMSLASLLGGMALANAGLGAVHGFAAPVGGQFNGPHGAICARLLPVVMEANLEALRSRQPTSAALPRYREVARLLTGRDTASPEDGVAWVRALSTDLDIPSLSTYGITPDDIPGLVENSVHASSMKGNPIELTRAELHAILTEALA